MIYTVTLNPALDKTAVIPGFRAGAVNRITALRTDPGGKGINVSKLLHALGVQSVALALLAGQTGDALASALAEQGIVCEAVRTAGQTRTNLKILDPESGATTDVNEPGPAASQAVLDELLERLSQRIAPGDVAVLSGSLPAGAAPDTYRVWTARLNDAGAAVFLDADGEALAQGVQALPALIKPNEQELARLTGADARSVTELARAALQLVDAGVEQAVVSMGGAGALFVTKEQILQADAVRVPVRSTVGAGDSVVAALALARQQKLPMEDAVRLCIACGAAAVTTDGSQCPSAELIRQLQAQVTFRKLQI